MGKEIGLKESLGHSTDQEIWGLCAWKKGIIQASVRFDDGHKYDYLSHYDVSECDKVIIGTNFKSGNLGGTTGKMGDVSDVSAKPTLNKNHAIALDFAFTRKISKKLVVTNAAMLENTLDEIQQLKDLIAAHKFPTGDDIFHPITLFARRVLAAVTVLAFPEYANDIQLDAARKRIEGESLEWAELIYFKSKDDLSIDLKGIHTPGNEERKRLLAQLLQSCNGIEYPDGTCAIDCKNKKQTSAYVAYIHTCSIATALGVMIRGDFANLFKVYLLEKSHAKDFLQEMKDVASKYQAIQCQEVLCQYERNELTVSSRMNAKP